MDVRPLNFCVIDVGSMHYFPLVGGVVSRRFCHFSDGKEYDNISNIYEM